MQSSEKRIAQLEARNYELKSKNRELEEALKKEQSYVYRPAPVNWLPSMFK